MKNLEDLQTIDDLELYVEGIINDFEFGITSKDETLKLIAELLIYMVNLTTDKCLK